MSSVWHGYHSLSLASILTDTRKQLALCCSFVNSLALASLSPLSPLALDTVSSSFGISANGSVVVGYSSSGTSSSNTPSSWNASSVASSLGVLSGFDGGYARTASHDGSVISGNCFGSASSGGGLLSRVFRWTASGGMQDIGSLPGSSGSVSGGYMNDAGDVIVGWDSVGAFRWSSDHGIQQLALPAGAVASNMTARNVSGDGTTIVGWNATSAVRWNAAGLAEVLAEPTGSFASYAYSTNGNGSLVAGVSASRSSGVLVQSLTLWADGGSVETLGVLSGGRHSVPFDMDAAGETIVGADQYIQEAFVWHRLVGIVSLYDYLGSLGADLTGWSRFSSAQGISADGSIVSGTGIYNGEARAFVFSGLTFASVPGASIAGLIPLGCLDCSRRRRR